MVTRICDICKKEKEIFFKCKIRKHTLTFDCDAVFDEPMWFRADICEECLKKIFKEVSKE